MRALPLLLVFASCATTARYSSFDDVDYGYRDERSVWSERAKLNVRIAELGSRTSTSTPIVLLHPWGFSMSIWADVAPTLAKKRRVVLVDLPGHGKSDKLVTRYSMRRLAAAVLDAADAAGLERFYVTGNSLGGATSIALAELAPKRLAGMVLVAAPGGALLPQPLRHAARSIATSSSLETLSDEAWSIGLVVAERSDSPLAVRLRDDIIKLRSSREWPAFCKATTAILRVAANFAPPLESIEVPALVVHGEADLLIWRSSSDAMAARLPNARFVALEGCGHMPEIECPEPLLEQLSKFLD